MSWADRKAYALRSALADALRELDPSTDDRAIAALEQNTQWLAGLACDPANDDDQERLDAFLAGAVERAVAGTVATCGASPSIEAVGNHLRTQAAGIVCASCADGEVCRGLPRSDDRIVSAAGGGLCIGNIRRAFDAASATARLAYSDVLGAADHPTLVLATEGASSPPGLLPAGVRIAANGTTNFYDQPDAKASRIS